MASPEEDPEQANVEEDPEEEDPEEEDPAEDPEQKPEAVEDFLLAQLTVQHHPNTRRVQQSFSEKPVAKISSPTATPSKRKAASPTTASPAKGNAHG